MYNFPNYFIGAAHMDATPNKSSTGMDASTAAGLSVLLAVLGIAIGPLIFFFIEKDSQFVKTHSMQALVLSIAAWVISWISVPLMAVVIGFLTILIPLIIWVFMIIQCIKAFQGERYLVPIFGKLSAKWAGEDV
jgi:uncharacterized membrane protein